MTEFLEKITILAEAKAELSQEISRFGTSSVNTDDINKIGSVLIAYGAKIDENTLISFGFADADSLVEKYDWWGSSAVFENENGEYFVYDLVLQDYPGNTYLTESYYLDAFDGGKEIERERTGPAESVSGNSKSYTVDCDIVRTVHYVFVRESEDEPWVHSMTSETLSAAEYHDMYMVISKDGKPESHSWEEAILKTVNDFDFDELCEAAVSLYSGTEEGTLSFEVAGTYTVDVPDEYGNDFVIELESLSLPFPDDSEYPVKNDGSDSYVIIAALLLAVTVIVCGAVIRKTLKK